MSLLVIEIIFNGTAFIQDEHKSGSGGSDFNLTVSGSMNGGNSQWYTNFKGPLSAFHKMI